MNLLQYAKYTHQFACNVSIFVFNLANTHKAGYHYDFICSMMLSLFIFLSVSLSQSTQQRVCFPLRYFNKT
jgi:hypothetical protein